MNLTSQLPSKDSITKSLSVDIGIFEEAFRLMDNYLATFPNEDLRKDFVKLINARTIIQGMDARKEREDYRQQLLWLHQQFEVLAQKVAKMPTPEKSSTSNEEEDWSWLFDTNQKLHVMSFIKFLPFLKAEFEGDDAVQARIDKMTEILYFFQDNPPFDALAEREEQGILRGIQKEMRLMLTERTIKLGSGNATTNEPKKQDNTAWKTLWQEAEKDLQQWKEANKNNSDNVKRNEFYTIWNKIGEKVWSLLEG